MKTKVYIRSFINQVFKQQCQLCRLISDTNEPLCGDCRQDLPWLKHFCPRCAEPLAVEACGQLCGHCQTHPPAFEHCFAPLRYQFPINILIQRFKNSADIAKVNLLAELFVQRWQQSLLAQQPPQLLIPVPLHRKRLYQRGFNQSLELADRLSRLLSIPVNNKACRRVVDTPHQIGLDAKQRRNNLRNAFSVNTYQLAEVNHLALVDDVVTTGTTAQILANELIKSGVARVDVWCLARTPSEPGRKR